MKKTTGKKTKTAAVKAAPKAPATKATRAAKPAKAASVPAVKAGAPGTGDTRIEAQIDVGFGNSLYIRGDGPGLSWERGIAMACVADDRWSTQIPHASRPIVCKFLINDLVWCSGDDFVVMPGKSVTLLPAF
jgi:hypothetical protein